MLIYKDSVWYILIDIRTLKEKDKLVTKGVYKWTRQIMIANSFKKLMIGRKFIMLETINCYC